MHKATLFDNLVELEEKFVKFFRHRKKVKALTHFSSVGNFSHQSFLALLKRCLRIAFLDAPESEFLDYLLKKYAINWLEWSHKTPWLKRQMAKMADIPVINNQISFPFDRPKSIAAAIPTHLLKQQKQKIGKRL